jgi:hypothetical protein
MVILLLVCGSLSKPLLSPQVIKVIKVDEENLLLTSTQPIESFHIEDMYAGTDYFLELDEKNKQVSVRMLTTRGPLKFIVTTTVPGSKGLQRKHQTTVLNPAKYPK